MSSKPTRREFIRSGLAGAAGLAAGGALPVVLSGRRRSAENILLVVADAMRGDKIGRAVNGLEVTPFLNSLAADGVHFRNAFSSAPFTKTSMAAILTGRYAPYNTVEYHCYTLPPDIETIQSFLRDRGYYTFGLQTNPWLLSEITGEVEAPDFGFSRGFDHYRDSLVNLSRGLASVRKTEAFTDGERVARAFFRLLANARADSYTRPVFAYVHFMDTHQPWVRAELTDFTGVFHEPGLVDRIGPAGVLKLDREVVKKVLLEREPPTEDEKAILDAINDEACALLDAIVGSMLDRLKRERLYDSTTIIFTSDHGDELYEHGALGHGKNLYNTSLHVPLVFKSSSLRSGVVERRVSNVSISPTVAGLLGEKPTDTTVASLFPGSGQGGSPVYANFNGKGKVILPGGTEIIEQHSGETLFFDLTDDAGEMNPLKSDADALTELKRIGNFDRASSQRDGVKAVLSTYAWQMVKDKSRLGGRIKIEDASHLSPRAFQQLKALGYLN